MRGGQRKEKTEMSFCNFFSTWFAVVKKMYSGSKRLKKLFCRETMASDLEVLIQFTFSLNVARRRTRSTF